MCYYVSDANHLSLYSVRSFGGLLSILEGKHVNSSFLTWIFMSIRVFLFFSFAHPCWCVLPSLGVNWDIHPIWCFLRQVSSLYTCHATCLVIFPHQSFHYHMLIFWFINTLLLPLNWAHLSLSSHHPTHFHHLENVHEYCWNMNK